MTAEQFTETVQHQRPALMRLARGFLHDEAEAEDVVQEVLLRMWLLRERLTASPDFVPLSVRITKNVCVSLWRQKQRQSVVALEAIKALEGGREASDSLEEQEGHESLCKALLTLTVTQRRMFLLWQQEMSIQEIAALMGVGPRTVSSTLSLARRKLFEFIVHNS